MEQRAFVRFIQSCRRRLNIAGFLKNAVFALMIGTAAGMIFQAVAFALPFYYANLYTGLALLLALAAAFVVALVRRKTLGQTALVMDSFGFEERIITAYENLGQDGALIALQREDAMRQLAAHKDRIRIPLWPAPKRLLGLLGLLVVLFVLIMVPADTKERAQELHAIREEADKKGQEIEEILDSLEELAQEDLTPEQQAAVEEIMTSLEFSLSEYQQAYSAEMLTAATEKLNYKYGEMSSELTNLMQNMANGSVTMVESVQAIAERMQDMSGMTLAQGDNGNSGQNGGSGQNNQNGQSSQNGQNGQGDGSGDGTGQGDGNGSGDGEGTGSGDGEGSGDGAGNGSGNGRGDGSSDTAHDYVSVPNAIADSGNLMGNAANHDTSEYFFAQNGLSWEGAHVSHEAVIGSYEQNAYEGIAAGRYPSGMEDIIKEYFASFNTK